MQSDSLNDDERELAEFFFGAPLNDPRLLDFSFDSVLSPDERRYLLPGPNDRRRIAELGYQAFEKSLSFEDRHEMVIRYSEANPNVFQFIVIPGLGRVGYTSLIPLKPTPFDEHRYGDMSQYKFSKEDIDVESPAPASQRIYVQAFVFDKNRIREVLQCLRDSEKAEPQNGKSHKRLQPLILHHIIRHLSLLNEDPMQTRPYLTAERFAAWGEKLLKAAGFDKTRFISATKNRIYAADFRDKAKLDEKQQTLLRLLHSLARKYARRRQRNDT